MISIDKALLRQLLLIERPWEVREYRLDVRKRRCDVWVAQEPERGWFGRARAAPASESLVWQHLAIGPVRFHLHVAVPLGLETRGFSWMGEPGLPFTQALASRIMALFGEGMSVQSVCTVLDLRLQDVWRYRYALDTGQANGAASEVLAPAEMRPATPAIPGLVPDDNSLVPDVTDPVWLRLIEGDVRLDIKVLSLKLMLTRLRSQLELIHDQDVRLLKLRELHRYFVKNERVLTHELQQLRQG